MPTLAVPFTAFGIFLQAGASALDNPGKQKTE
jgi:hypothetical protein